jgi:broad specificity phosphatase PhoE
MARMLVVRHAQSEWNAVGRWQGWADPGLSPLGRRQATLAGLRLEGDIHPVAVWASDLARARQTAELVARGVGWTGEVGTDVGLREHDIGAWSGLTSDEIGERWPGQLALFRAGQLDSAPGGELLVGFGERVVAALLGIAARTGPGEVLVVTHGGALGAVERRLGVAGAHHRHLTGRWLEGDGNGLRPGPAADLLGEERDRLEGLDLGETSESEGDGATLEGEATGS